MMRSALCRVLLLFSLVSVREAAVLGPPQQPIQITSEDEPLFDTTFDAFVEATLQKWHVPGLSIAVVDNGKTVSKVSFSFFHLRFVPRFRLVIFYAQRLC